MLGGNLRRRLGINIVHQLRGWSVPSSQRCGELLNLPGRHDSINERGGCLHDLRCWYVFWVDGLDVLLNLRRVNGVGRDELLGKCNNCHTLIQLHCGDVRRRVGVCSMRRGHRRCHLGLSIVHELQRRHVPSYDRRFDLLSVHRRSVLNDNGKYGLLELRNWIISTHDWSC